MKKLRLGVAGLVALLLLSMTVVRATPQDANFVGTWEIATGGGQGGGGTRGGGAQVLTITQDGTKFRVSHKTPRGENAYDAAVSGNTISWTEERQGRGGNTISIEYKATLNGDTMKGTRGGARLSRGFTAKRSN